MLMLIAIWWTWSVTSTTTEFYDPQQRPIQVILMVAMVGAVGMAASLPMITGAQALTFALAYVGTHVVRGIVLLTLYRQHHRSTLARAARFLFWFLVSGVLWIVGALTDSGRWWLWSIAIAIDLISAAARYPTPGLGRVPLDQYDRTTAHLGERYQQFVILALGDIILVPTLELSRSEFDGLRITALICGFVIMLLLWQVYVFRAGELLETGAGRAGRPGLLRTPIWCCSSAWSSRRPRSTWSSPTDRVDPGAVVDADHRRTVAVRARPRPVHLLLSARAVAAMRCLLLPLLPLPWAGGWPPVLVSAVVALGLAGHVLIPGGGRETTRGLGHDNPSDDRHRSGQVSAGPLGEVPGTRVHRLLPGPGRAVARLVADLLDQPARHAGLRGGPGHRVPLHVDQVGALRQPVPLRVVGHEGVTGGQHRALGGQRQRRPVRLAGERAQQVGVQVVLEHRGDLVDAGQPGRNAPAVPRLSSRVGRGPAASTAATALAAFTLPMPVSRTGSSGGR